LSVTPQRLRETVRSFNRSEKLLPRNGLVVTAVSGGPDSMALLSILNTLAGEFGFRVAVAYFDHRIRESSKKDQAPVEEYAKGLGLAVHAGAGDVRDQAARSGDSLEEAARRARYRFLASVADETGARCIATGHTRDDQVETVVMRILHGTGVRGLAGIPERRGRIIRPLLCLGRGDTRAYCDELGIPYALDPTNEDRRIFRNQIRHDLLPLLESSYHEGVRENLLRLAENARRMITDIRMKTNPLIERNLRKMSDNEWTLDVTHIAPMDDTSIVVLFGDVFGESLGCDMDFSRVHYERLVGLARDEHGSGKALHLPGLTIKREYENLVITRASGRASTVQPADCRATLTFPGETRATGVVVTTEIMNRTRLDESSIKATDRTACFAMDHLRLPLVVRSATAGDRIQPFGMSGTKKLSDMFIDKKIPGRERAKSLVVADADEIVWAIGLTTSEKSQVTQETGEVVRITVEKE
jgi:tRNA(Ile)-lysidine synthase